MLLSLLIGLCLLSGTSLQGMAFALHAMASTQQQAKNFAQATQERLAEISGKALDIRSK